MDDTPDTPELTIRSQHLPDGSTRLDLMQGERSVSHIDRIVPFVLRIGAARVRMDGIAGVGTEPDCRKQGYAARVLNAAVAHMREGDAALSMLYGIRDYYPRFGYATAGPEHFLRLTQEAAHYPLPAGWSVRPATPADLPAIHALYEQMAEHSVGTAVRSPGGAVWSKLAALVSAKAGEARAGDEPAEPLEECRVVVAPSGQVEGYAWRSDSFWYVRSLARSYAPPGTLILAEVAARDRIAALAVLAACRAWAAETAGQSPPRTALLPVPPDSALAAAARMQSAEFTCGYSRCGASMVLTIDSSRLLHSLLPELNIRWQQARLSFRGELSIVVDGLETVLSLDDTGVRIVGEPDRENRNAMGEGANTVVLPQQCLARLALGAYPPDELLADLPSPPVKNIQQVLCALFPERHPHMSLPDRF